MGSDNSFDSMLAKKQTVSVLNKSREEYNVQIQKGEEIGLEEELQDESGRGSEKDTHDIDGTETVHTTVPKHSVDPKCIPKSFIPITACETSVDDVLTPQQFITPLLPPLCPFPEFFFLTRQKL